MRELDRRLRVNLFADDHNEGQTVTQKVLLSSRRQTLEYEAKYRTWVLDSTEEYQESLDAAEEPEEDLHALLRSTAEDTDEEE